MRVPLMYTLGVLGVAAKKIMNILSIKTEIYQGVS